MENQPDPAVDHTVSLYMTDEPCGLRKQVEQVDHLGLNKREQTNFRLELRSPPLTRNQG
ncbi:hypothetical protein [Paenibacillus sp. BIC5C1]|uniref:hypothetical protein n=1 Tax=Paenibacillus sp. BIC5C1 TaxID=3078263 RepID=UPI0028EC6D0C|nr:hypothetical protein [Paenibacillus sp. BIC5C1]